MGKDKPGRHEDDREGQVHEDTAKNIDPSEYELNPDEDELEPDEDD